MEALTKRRESGLELFRIILMLGIVAYHYVVSGNVVDLVVRDGATARNFWFITAFGIWGKIGINCFVLITGYYMCKSAITWKKFFKLYFEIVFYCVFINALFVLTGYAPLTGKMILNSLFPVGGITSSHFWGAFLIFYLTIPFLNVLVNNLTQRQHLSLIVLALIVYSALPLIPGFDFAFNLVEWFAVLYFISSYFRLHPHKLLESTRFWGGASIIAVACCIGSAWMMGWLVPLFLHVRRGVWFWVTDVNKITALAASVCFFLFFKNLKLHYSRIINTVASATFGVLVIHANSDVMRQWLWHDVCDNVAWYASPWCPVHAIACVVAIFVLCTAVDLLRQRFVERPIQRRLFPNKESVS